MSQTGWFSANAALLLCLFGRCCGYPAAKILPVTFLKGDSLRCCATGFRLSINIVRGSGELFLKNFAAKLSKPF